MLCKNHSEGLYISNMRAKRMVSKGKLNPLGTMLHVMCCLSCARKLGFQFTNVQPNTCIWRRAYYHFFCLLATVPFVIHCIYFSFFPKALDKFGLTM